MPEDISDYVTFYAECPSCKKQTRLDVFFDGWWNTSGNDYAWCGIDLGSSTDDIVNTAVKIHHGEGLGIVAPKMEVLVLIDRDYEGLLKSYTITGDQINEVSPYPAGIKVYNDNILGQSFMADEETYRKMKEISASNKLIKEFEETPMRRTIIPELAQIFIQRESKGSKYHK
jgi:hypothetical protein